MGNISEKATQILARNLNTGLSYPITTVLSLFSFLIEIICQGFRMEKKSILARNQLA
jgi:hypothetical protein